MTRTSRAGVAGAEPAAVLASVRGRAVLVAVLAAIGAAATLVPYLVIVALARELWPALADAAVVDDAAVWRLVATGVAGLLVATGCLLAAGLVGHLADSDLQRNLRRQIVDHLARLPLGWFGRRSSGEVKKLVENDVSALHQLIAHAIMDLTLGVTVPLASLVYLLVVDWRMGLAALLPVVLTVGCYAAMMRGGNEKFAQYDSSVGRLNAATVEYVHGIAVVKSFGQGRRSHARFRDETRRFTEFYDGWMRETSVLQSVTDIVSSPVVVMGYLAGVGAALVGVGTAAPPDVLPAMVLGLGLTAPLMQLGYTAQNLRHAIKARESLQEFFATPAIPQPAEPRPPAGGDVALHEVSFSYREGHLALTGVELECRPGTVTALVGASGSGKSTLARLVPRFHDASSGTVAVGGIDVTEIGDELLYGHVGFVFQDPYLLRTTIRDNIRLTRPDAGPDEVERAARAAQIHDRILRLPRGYESVIGEDAHLSGGEGQRLTIARALLTDAPVLVLDEATAFADPDSEAQIQRALTSLAAERTLVVIAHRLHTITAADQIVVLDQGRIVQRGTHAELAAGDGPYHQLWQRYRAARNVEKRNVEKRNVEVVG